MKSALFGCHLQKSFEDKTANECLDIQSFSHFVIHTQNGFSIHCISNQ